jgi:glycosyltransferase involved in cell wall biosynthesis
MKQPGVSVIMSVYNGQRYLEEAVDSILNQTFKNFEFIVIDDGSTDKTPETLRDYAQKDSRIKVITNSQNIGLTRSLNRGIKIARGEYIARMDADDISMPERLEKQISVFETHERIGCVGCNVLVVDKEGELIKKVRLPKTDVTLHLRKRNCFVHGSLVFSRKALSAVGGYNPEMKLAQDYDLLLRLSKKYKTSYVNDFLYKLRRNTKGLSCKKFYSQVYYTALTKSLNLTNSSSVGKIVIVRDVLYSLLVIYKIGLPRILRAFGLIK